MRMRGSPHPPPYHCCSRCGSRRRARCPPARWSPGRPVPCPRASRPARAPATRRCPARRRRCALAARAAPRARRPGCRPRTRRRPAAPSGPAPGALAARLSGRGQRIYRIGSQDSALLAPSAGAPGPEGEKLPAANRASVQQPDPVGQAVVWLGPGIIPRRPTGPEPAYMVPAEPIAVN